MLPQITVVESSPSGPRPHGGTALATAAITGLSANTCLGDAVTAAAAARANMSHPGALDALFIDEADGPQPITAHAVPTVNGFRGPARLLSLALPALQSLGRDLPPPHEGLGLFLALPDVAAPGSPLANPGLGRTLDQLIALANLNVAANYRREFPLGRTAFPLAVQSAMASLARHEVGTCIVGAVDSLCDESVVNRLLDQGRVKTPDNPVGLQPGEAAVFVLLETVDSARRRQATTLAVMTGVSAAPAPQSRDESPPRPSLFSALLQLTSHAGALAAGEAFFVLDCNGEPLRAQDWGNCQQLLVTNMPGVLPAPEWTPAVSFGDAGTANAALATALAIRSFARGYAPRPAAIVLASGDDGTSAALRVQAGA